MNLSMDEVCWLAGILEGDGCFRFQINKPIISLQMIDEDTIQNFSNMVTCSYQKFQSSRRNHKLIFTASMKKQGCFDPAKQLRSKNKAEFATAHLSIFDNVKYLSHFLKIHFFGLILFQIWLSFLDEKS